MEEFAYSIYTDDKDNGFEVEFEGADTFEEAERKFYEQSEKYRDDPSTVTYLYAPLNGNMIMESDLTTTQ